MKAPVRVAVTGAAGQIGYALLFRIASGAMLGADQPVILQLLEITPALKALDGVHMELDDCAFPLLHSVEKSDDPNVAFRDADYAILVGGIPRKAGMERSDLLNLNGGIYKPQGEALSANAKKDIEAVKDLPTDEIHPSIFGLKDEEKAHNIEVNRRKRAEGVYNAALEELNPASENYYRFIIALIDAGAYYSNLVYPERTNPFVPGNPSYAKDQAKTSFFYRVAKDMLKLAEKKEVVVTK